MTDSQLALSTVAVLAAVAVLVFGRHWAMWWWGTRDLLEEVQKLRRAVEKLRPGD